MSAFHHKAELLSVELPRLRYRFLPRCIDDNPQSGVFEVDITNWEREVIESSGDPADSPCVAALVHKLKKHLASDANPPQTIYHTA